MKYMCEKCKVEKSRYYDLNAFNKDLCGECINKSLLIDQYGKEVKYENRM